MAPTSLLLLIIVFSCEPNKEEELFIYHSIADQLPGEGWGTGGFTLNDYDGDGDLDITIQRRSNEGVYWYAFEDQQWTMHIVGSLGGGQLGAASTDINGDHYPDLIMGRAWFQNPGVLKQSPDTPWAINYYNGGLPEENHDIEVADINRDGRPDIVCYAQSSGVLRWYDTSDPLHWKFQDIAVDVHDDHVHSGFSPHGIGDLNGDQFPDIVMPYYWYKNPGNSKDTTWKKNKWPYREIVDTPYGHSVRSWIIDVDNDGDNDFIATDSDVMNSKAYWLENKDTGNHWEIHPLPLPAGPTGSFHSLQVFDVNEDGLMDIFIGEQEDRAKGMKPEGLKERGILLIRTGSQTKPAYTLSIIHEDNPGWHDTIAGDVDGDGDIDLVTKIWNADEKVIYHADYWENREIK